MKLNSKITALQKQQLIIAAVACGGLLIGLLTVVKPGVSLIARIQKEIMDVDRKKELLEKIRNTKAKIKAGEAVLNSETQKSTVLSHLATLASKHQLEIDSVAPLAQKGTEPKQVGIYQDYYIQVKGQGQFQKLLAFLDSVQKMQPKVSVVEAQFNPKRSYSSSNREKASTLSVSIVLKTLLISQRNNPGVGTEGSAT